jgi:beta-phosphoglucomutase-like phosphatase (HAD superfamily)
MKAAILFDMDDTLVATGPVWLRAEVRLFRALGSEHSAEIAARYKGQNVFDLGATVWAALRPAGVSARECGQMMRRFLLEELAGPVEQLEGADALVRALAPLYPLALASGSPLEAIQGVLRRCGWSELFRVVISSESVAAGKPAPDVFLKAAELIGAPPRRCLVFEDSLHGVKAARAAGMTCFVVPSRLRADHSTGESAEALADRAFATLADVTPAEVATALDQASTKKG